MIVVVLAVVVVVVVVVSVAVTACVVAVAVVIVGFAGLVAGLIEFLKHCWWLECLKRRLS